MPAISSEQRAAIIIALQDLRRVLANGPQESFPASVLVVAHNPKFANDRRRQRAIDVRLAALALRDALHLVGLSQYAPVELQGPWTILNVDLYHLDYLPASGTALRTLQQSIEDLGGKPDPSEGNGGADSTPKQPAADLNIKKEEVLAGLEPADRKAYSAYQYAETMAEKRLQDREAYDWLKENGIDANKGDVGELADYELPDFPTWTRQLRNARNPLGEQKYTRRAGRDTGRSIVTAKEIEYQGGGDE